MTSYWLNPETNVTHAVSSEGNSEYTACGKPVSIFWDGAGGPATCNTCLISLSASRDYRTARDLAGFCRELLADVEGRPGAYIHADRAALDAIRAVLNGMDIEAKGGK